MKIVCAIGRDVSGFVGKIPKLHNNLFDEIDPNRFKRRPVTYTAYRLLIQGVLGGFLISLATRDLWPIVGGFTMAPIYYVGVHILQRERLIVRDGLRISELAFGGLFAVACTASLWLPLFYR